MTEQSHPAHRFGEVTVSLSVELGRAELPLREVLSLGEGSVVSLNRLTDELLDVTANGREIAKGEIVTRDGKFALRIVSLAGQQPPTPEANAPTEAAASGAPDAESAS